MRSQKLPSGPFWPCLVCGLLLGITWAGRASAEVPLPISVERQPGAEACPDTAGLIAQVRAIVGRDSSSSPTPYRVTFTRSGQTFTAAIRLGSADADGTTVRSLEAREPTCAPLAHATAIALAVLFDNDLDNEANKPSAPATAPTASKPAEAAAPPTASAPAPPKPPAAKPKAEPDATAEASDVPPFTGPSIRIDPTLAVGGAALVGVLRPLGFGVVMDAGLDSKNIRGSVGALYVPPETLTLAPGSARESLLSGTLRGCVAVFRAGALRFDGCTGALLGIARAQASGFTVNQPEHHELFLAFPAEVALSSRSRFVGWELSAAALLLCPPNEFNVEGLGEIYHPAPVAGMFTLRVFVEPLR